MSVEKVPYSAVKFLRHFTLGPVPAVLQYVELGAWDEFMRFLCVDKRDAPIFFAVDDQRRYGDFMEPINQVGAQAVPQELALLEGSVGFAPAWEMGVLVDLVY